MTYHRVGNWSNTTDVTSGSGTSYGLTLPVHFQLPLSVFLTIIEYATVCFFLTSGGNRINMRDRRGGVVPIRIPL
jgi:hypothetical protein